MYYKITRQMFDQLIAFVCNKANSDPRPDIFGAISEMTFKRRKEGSHWLIPVKSMQKILEVPEYGNTMVLLHDRNDLVVSVFNCEIVNVPPVSGVNEFWQVRIPNRNGAVATFTSNQYYEVKNLYNSDQKIQAIKLIREFTGLGLKAAKEIYEETFSSAEKVDNPDDNL